MFDMVSGGTLMCPISVVAHIHVSSTTHFAYQCAPLSGLHVGMILNRYWCLARSHLRYVRRVSLVPPCTDNIEAKSRDICHDFLGYEPALNTYSYLETYFAHTDGGRAMGKRSNIIVTKIMESRFYVQKKHINQRRRK